MEVGIEDCLHIEFEYDPVSGLWGMFSCGSWGHSMMVRCFGSQWLIEKDWKRFVEKLVTAHAWTLSSAKTKGWDLAQAVGEKIELELIGLAEPMSERKTSRL